MLNVINIIFDTRLYRGIAAKVIYLRPACNSWAHLMLYHVKRYFIAELLHKVRQLGSRAYKAHIALEYIEELWELVK